jgi:predicted dehydrogenase
VKQINWGIIGLGSVATQFAKGFRTVDNAKLLGIASKTISKLKKFQKDFEINNSYCFNNYENLIENTKIDIVYIALPNFLHYEWIVKCLKKGKNVLVEKPATINSLEIEDIKKKYSNKKFFFNEAFMYLHHPQIKKVLELIKSGMIGKLVSMKSVIGKNILTKKNFLGFKKNKKIDLKNRLYNKKMGGGVILDLGCYPISFSTLIASLESKINFDKVNIINSRKKIGSMGVDIDAYIELEFENNFKSKVASSFTKNLGNETTIFGRDGEIVIKDTWMAQNSQIIVKKIDKDDLVINIELSETIYSHEIRVLSQCILEHKINADFPSLTIDDTINNMKIIDKWMSESHEK